MCEPREPNPATLSVAGIWDSFGVYRFQCILNLESLLLPKTFKFCRIVTGYYTDEKQKASKDVSYKPSKKYKARKSSIKHPFQQNQPKLNLQNKGNN